MPAIARLTLVLGMILSTATLLPAQDVPAGGPAGPKRAQYDQVYGKWQNIIRGLRALRIEYDTAKPDRKKEIESEYDKLVKQGEAIEGPLVEAAIGAYEEAPGKDAQLGEFLMGILAFQVGSDDYENAFKLAQTLIDGGVTDPSIYPMAAQSAFGIGEFDTAEKYFKIAGEDGSLSDQGKGLASTIPYYKEVWPKEQKIRAAEAKADDLPRVRMVTEHGEMEIDLFENEAPNTVANFISLIEEGFYDGLTFHRVLPMFMAQGGCPDGTGGGGPGYTIPCECVKPEHRLHFRGSLSMAKKPQPNTGGSQFFLCFVPTGQLDGKHTVFGRVSKGIEILGKIRKRDPEDPNAGEGDKIIKMEVIRKRDHEYVPKKGG
jgi:cyclophilin family peptidyl-prolyl cis-trans isomerase